MIIEYAVGGILLFILLVFLIIKLDKPPKPYRIAKNGLGEYLLQSYEEVTPTTIYCENPLRPTRIYKYVTIRKFDMLDEAIASYKKHMEEYNLDKKVEHEKEEYQKSLDKKKELEQTIVKVYKIKD